MSGSYDVSHWEACETKHGTINICMAQLHNAIDDYVLQHTRVCPTRMHVVPARGTGMLTQYTALNCVAMHAAKPHRLVLCFLEVEEDQ